MRLEPRRVTIVGRCGHAEEGYTFQPVAHPEILPSTALTVHAPEPGGDTALLPQPAKLQVAHVVPEDRDDAPHYADSSRRNSPLHLLQAAATEPHVLERYLPNPPFACQFSIRRSSATIRL